jgi:hypothetical protein
VDIGPRLCAQRQPQRVESKGRTVLRTCCGWSRRHSRAPGQNGIASSLVNWKSFADAVFPVRKK